MLFTREEIDEILRKSERITNSGHAREHAAYLRASLRRHDSLVRKREKDKTWEDIQRESRSLSLDINDPRSRTD